MSRKPPLKEIIEALGATPPDGDSSITHLLWCIADAVDNFEAQPADLSGYAALDGAVFTGAVSGIAPTVDAHLATKKYVDDAIAAAIAALDTTSGE